MNDIQKQALGYIRDDMRWVLREVLNIQIALLELRIRMSVGEWQEVREIVRADLREDIINSPNFAEGFDLLWQEIKTFLPE